MLFGNRDPRSAGKRGSRQAFRPRGESLENKLLLTLVPLGGGNPTDLSGVTTTPPQGPAAGILPAIADFARGSQTTDPGLGILETGSSTTQGVGFSVAALTDVNADNIPDYLIGAPSVDVSGNLIVPSTGINSQAFLLFGSRSATVPVLQDWLTVTPEQRVGNINTLGNAIQSNPFTNRGAPYNFNFDGITFITSQVPNSQLGAFVASAGPNAFLIGAPNYVDPNGIIPGVGRVYLISGGANFNALPFKQIDLDNPLAFPGITIVTFYSSLPNSAIGSSFTFMSNFFGDGQNNIVIGSPTADLNGLTNNGAVYVISSQFAATPAAPIDIATTGNGGLSGVILQGANSNDQVGASVASAGNVDGDTGPLLTPIQDLLIGAPNALNGAGEAYLVYGGSGVVPLPDSNPTPGVGILSTVILNRLDNPANVTTANPTPVPGAIFTGVSNSGAGFSVSTAGDFDLDGLSDFMIGAPFTSANAGRVYLLYGSNGSSTPIIYGTISLTTLGGSVFPNVIFNGASGGDRAGYSLAGVGPSGLNQPSPILIGAPGFQTGAGTVYQLQTGPGRTRQRGTLTLTQAISRQFTLARPSGVTATEPINLGLSVSAQPFAPGGNFILGAPGYYGTLASRTAPLAGAAAVLLEQLLNSVVGAIPPLGGGPSDGGGGGGGVRPGGLLTVLPPPGLVIPTELISPFGTNFVPAVSTLSRMNYAPIPLSVAIEQFLPPDGFRQRIQIFNHPGSKPTAPLVGRNQNRSRFNDSGSGIWTLGRDVFTRGRFHWGQSDQWTHRGAHGSQPGRVVPATLSTQRYTSRGHFLGR